MNSLQRTAMGWVEKGISPIPVMPRSKLPVYKWTRWQNELPTEKEIKYWFQDENTNMALVCGGSNKLVVIDIDKANRYKEIIDRLSPKWQSIFNSTYRVKTSRGYHVYLRVLQRTMSHRLPDIDIQSDGHVVICPPSIHPSGEKYTVDNNSEIANVDSISEVFPEPDIKSIERRTVSISPVTSFIDKPITIEDIKRSINILDLVSKYGKPRSTGNGYYMLKCIYPTHKDNHPSLRVDVNSQRVKCLSGHCALSSDRGLDVIDLYCVMENVNVRTAVEELRCW